MKKAIVTVCVLSLLLAGCSDPETPASTQTTRQTEAAPTTAAPVTEPTATEPATTEPTPQPSGYQAAGTPTSGGITVHTDPSAYVPYTGTERKFTRLHDGPLDHFEPADDYGAVYPYVAAREFASGDDGYSWSDWELYGLVDRNGRILTDGLYTKISPMRYEDYMYGYGDDQITNQPYWITTRYDFVERHYEEGGDESWYWDETTCHMGVISMDGSFVLPDDYVSVEPFQEGFCCKRDWDSKDFEVYDGQGKLCFTGEQVMDPDADGWRVEYGEGLYLLSNYYNNDSRDECWFVDAQGNQVLGPYQYALCFRDGIACVSMGDERYGCLDKTGAVVIDGVARYAEMTRNGFVVLTLADDSKAVYDCTGALIMRFGADTWISVNKYGIRAEQNGLTKYYDRAGNLLAEGNDYLQAVDANTFSERKDGVYRLFRADGTELSVGSDLYSQGIWSMVLDGEAVSGYLFYGYRDNEPVYSFVPGDLSAVIPVDESGLHTNERYAACHSVTDPCTGERWNLTWDKNGWNAVSASGVTRRFAQQSTWITLYGDRTRVVTDRSCQFLDETGALVFSYPIEAGD